jgi:hypothetical protein
MASKEASGAERTLAANAAKAAPEPRGRAWLTSFLKGKLDAPARLDATFGLDTFERASRNDAKSMDMMTRLSERASSHGAEALKTFLLGMCEVSITARGTDLINEVMGALSHLLGLAKAVGLNEEGVCAALSSASLNLKEIAKSPKDAKALEKALEPFYLLGTVPQALEFLGNLASGKSAANKSQPAPAISTSSPAPAAAEAPAPVGADIAQGSTQADAAQPPSPVDAGPGRISPMIEGRILTQGNANGDSAHEISLGVMLARENLAVISRSVKDPVVVEAICGAAMKLGSIFFISRYLAYMADASQAIGAAIPNEQTLLKQANAVAKYAEKSQSHAERAISGLAEALHGRNAGTP